MPNQAPVSLILMVTSLIPAAVMQRWSEPTLIGLAGVAVLLFAARYAAKIEDDNSSASIFIGLAALVLAAIIAEPGLGSFIVIALSGIPMWIMRMVAKTEAREERTMVGKTSVPKPH